MLDGEDGLVEGEVVLVPEPVEPVVPPVPEAPPELPPMPVLAPEPVLPDVLLPELLPEPVVPELELGALVLPEVLEPDTASRRQRSFSRPVSRSQRVLLAPVLDEPVAPTLDPEALPLAPVDELPETDGLLVLELEGLLELPELDGLVVLLELDGLLLEPVDELPALDGLLLEVEGLVPSVVPELEPVLPLAPVLPLLPDVCARLMLPILNSAAATAAPKTFIFIVLLLIGSSGE